MKRSQVVLERTSSIAVGCDRTSNLPATRSLERLTAANFNFSPSPVCDRARQIRSAVILCLLLPKCTQQETFLATYTAIGTHSRFTRQFLGYAQRERLARTLFYDFPVTPDMRCFLDHKGRFVRQERPLRWKRPLCLMASHWPPENLPLREVELRAGYIIAWMQRLFEPGSY
jgi:hypothetical protein